MEKLPKTRREAMVEGERFYFNGNLCKHNHLSPRRTDSKCRQCVNDRENAKYKNKSEGKVRRVRDIEELTSIAKVETKKEALKNNRRYFIINCSKCNLSKVHDVKSRLGGCIECIRKRSAKINKEAYIPKEKKEETYNTIENILYMYAQARAKKKKSEFSIKYEDVFIPEYCPILGIKIDKFLEDTSQSHKSRASSPSLDRVDSSKGYIKGNVTVISYRANILKGQGTAKQHRLIASWIRKNT
ncbi:hypothetical protein N9367_03175 [Gammaproteobacteria bacterium]|nr:hypothetical protein [Gammaproteobacteria bacterium]